MTEPLLSVDFLPIPTVGLPRWQQWRNVFFYARKFVIPEDKIIHDQLIPGGHVGDGLSVPKLLRWILDPFCVALLPSVVHDFEMRYRVRLDQNGTVIAKGLTRKQCDARFAYLCEVINGMPDYAAVLYVAVRLGSWIAWNRHRRNDHSGQNDWRRLLDKS